MERDQFDYMAELFRMACKYNADDFHVFCNFSGHVNQIELKVYVGGWESGKEAELNRMFYVEFERTYQEIGAREALLALTRLHRLYRKHGISKLREAA